MSHPENDKLYEEFIETLEEVIVCPYCGDSNQLGPPLLCCGEVHACEAYLQDSGETNKVLLYDSDIKAAFNKWIKDRG